MALGNAVLFPVIHDEHGWELWRTDGTAEQTTLIKEIPQERSIRISDLTRVSEGITFFASTEDAENCLYISDNTDAGTQPLEAGGAVEKLTGKRSDYPSFGR